MSRAVILGSLFAETLTGVFSFSDLMGSGDLLTFLVTSLAAAIPAVWHATTLVLKSFENSMESLDLGALELAPNPYRSVPIG